MKNKLRFLSFSILIILIFIITFTSCENIPSGHEGVFVEKPILFGHGGIDDKPTTTGRVYLAPTTEVILINMQPKKYVEKFEDIITADKIAVSFNAYINLRVTEGKSPVIVDKFGLSWYDNNIKEAFRNKIRERASIYSMTQLITRDTTLNVMESNVSNDIKAIAKEIGLPIEVIGVLIGKASPHENVLKTMNETASQQQAQKTEIEKAKTEELRKQTETLRAQADDAYRRNMNLSPDEFIKLKAIDAQLLMAKNPNASFVIGLNGGITLPLNK